MRSLYKAALAFGRAEETSFCGWFFALRAKTNSHLLQRGRDNLLIPDP